MVYHTPTVTSTRKKAFWQTFMLLLGALYAKIAVIHFAGSCDMPLQYHAVEGGASSGSLTQIVINPELKNIEDTPVDYTVVVDDRDGITQQLQNLIEQYRPRWQRLRSADMTLFLEEAAQILAPRLFPLLAHKYKDYQFLHQGNARHGSFYEIRERTSWGSTIGIGKIDDATLSLSCYITYPKHYNKKASPEETIFVLAHEMVHRVRMHPARLEWHDERERSALTEVEAPDFLRDALHVDFQHVCNNLSQHQESEADYCALIALRSLAFIKAEIVFALAEGFEWADECSATTHPTSLYRARLGIEYWIQFLMKRDQLTYENACQVVGIEYRALIAEQKMDTKFRQLVLQIAPDNTNFLKQS